MGMSIDEALNLLNNSKPKSNNAFSIQMNEAINVIGVTMHKYQKITKIYQWAKDRSYLVEADDIMDKLKEVIENGNDD